MRKNPLHGDLKIKEKEKVYTDKLIFKKIILYALPFVLIALLLWLDTIRRINN